MCSFLKQALRDYLIVSAATALRMLRDAGVSSSMMVTTRAVSARTMTTRTWAMTARAWAVTTGARAMTAWTRTGAWAEAGMTEAWTTETRATRAEAGVYAGTRTPAAPAAWTAPAEAAVPSIAAPVPAGSAPAVEIKAIAAAAEEELRLFKRRCLACGHAELGYRHRLRWRRDERARRQPDTEGNNSSSQSLHHTILLFVVRKWWARRAACSPFNILIPRWGFAFQADEVSSATLERP